MVDDDRLIGLLVQWDQRRQRGEVVSASEMCRDCPELAPLLGQQIADLKATDWLLDAADERADDFLSRPTTTASRDDTQTYRPPLPLEQFIQAISGSGLLNAEQIAELPQPTAAATSLSLAADLIATKKLTAYQVSALLEGRDDPLLLDRYVILDELGAGGMGVVYKALQRSLDRIVALKTLSPAAVDSPSKVQRFKMEATAAARLDHPNIVTTYDADESEGVHFLVMEYVPGRDLFKVVDEQGPLPVSSAVDYVLQAARGLSHAHSRRITHRDIKPGNLLLSEDRTVKILDLGLSRIDLTSTSDGSGGQDLTDPGMVMGTAAYMAPEQAANTREADHRSDIYSLGCTLHFLLTGHPPYPHDTPVKTILAHRSGPMPSIADQRDDVPEELVAVYRRMLAKQPEDRYQSVDEVIAALEPCAAVDEETAPVRRVSEPTGPAKPAGATRASPVGRRLRPWVAVLVGALLVGGIAFSAVLLKIKFGDKKTVEVRLELPAAAEISSPKQPVTDSEVAKPPVVSPYAETGYYGFWIDFELRLRVRDYEQAQRVLCLAIADPALIDYYEQLRRDQRDLDRLIAVVEAAESALPDGQNVDELPAREIVRLASQSLDLKDPETLLSFAILHRVDGRGDFYTASKLIRQAVDAGADAGPWLAMTPEAIQNSLGMTMIQIPRTRRYATSYLSACEVTRNQYAEVIGELPAAVEFDPTLEDTHGADAGSLPMSLVSWYEAALFCNALNKRESLDPYYKVTRSEDGWEVEWLRSKGYRLPGNHELALGARSFSFRGFSFNAFMTKLDHFAWHRDNSGGKRHTKSKTETRPNLQIQMVRTSRVQSVVITGALSNHGARNTDLR